MGRNCNPTPHSRVLREANLTPSTCKTIDLRRVGLRGGPIAWRSFLMSLRNPPLRRGHQNHPNYPHWHRTNPHRVPLVRGGVDARPSEDGRANLV